MNSIAQVKKLFFDRAAVMSAMDKATRRALSKFGAFVRQTSRNSIRSGEGTSAPGQPPRSHTGLLKRFIWFAYQPATRSVVIGPALLNKPASAGEAPALLEYGGVASRRVQAARGGSFHPRYRARPFMRPAFEREQRKLPACWANSVK